MAYTAAGAAMPRRSEGPEITVFPDRDESATMRSVQWIGSKDIRVVDQPRPKITDPADVILHVTSTAICGSDLHLYGGFMPGMKKGDVMGHEFMGIVEAAGPEVRTLVSGDRVVVSFDIACGHCGYCKIGDFTGCDNTNPSKEQEALYGHHTSGIFGYSHLTGGYPGGQADYVRVPLADVNCLKLPPASQLPDDRVILLSDVLSTAWHACELGRVVPGDAVAIWGAGPVGILAAHCAQARGAARVVLIDCEQYRLDYATARLPGLETINFKQRKTLDTLHEMFQDDHGRYIGPDVCIEAVGFHYTQTWTHWLEMALKLENDPSEILNELIYACRKGGRLSVVGVYSGYANHFNIGAFMEKGLSMGAGQTPVQRYWKDLLERVTRGELKPDIVITHRLPLEKAPDAYRIFDQKEDGCVKVVLKPAGGGGGGVQAMSEQ